MASMEDNAKRASQDRKSDEHGVRHEIAGRRRRDPPPPLPPSQRPDGVTIVFDLGGILCGQCNGVREPGGFRRVLTFLWAPVSRS